jgi:hypothetical protein
MTPQEEYEWLNPPMESDEKGDLFFGCLTWVLIIGGVVALVRWVFF